MNLLKLKEELEKIRGVIPVLERYPDYTLQKVPRATRNILKKIGIIPPITSGGLESCATVLNYLYWAQYLAERELNSTHLEKEEKLTPLSKKSPRPPLVSTQRMTRSPKPPSHSLILPEKILPKNIERNILVKRGTKEIEKVDKGIDFGPYYKK